MLKKEGRSVHKFHHQNSKPSFYYIIQMDINQPLITLQAILAPVYKICSTTSLWGRKKGSYNVILTDCYCSRLTQGRREKEEKKLVSTVCFH